MFVNPGLNLLVKENAELREVIVKFARYVMAANQSVLHVNFEICGRKFLVTWAGSTYVSTEQWSVDFKDFKPTFDEHWVCSFSSMLDREAFDKDVLLMKMYVQ